MGRWLIVVARISLFGQAATRANAPIGHTPSGFEGAAGPDLRRSRRGFALNRTCYSLPTAADFPGLPGSARKEARMDFIVVGCACPSAAKIPVAQEV